MIDNTDDNVTREELEKRLIRGMSQIMPKQKFEEFKEMLSQMPDVELFNLYIEAKRSAIENGEPSVKQFSQNIKDLRKAFGATSTDIGMMDIPVEFINDADNETILKSISESKSSDVIRLTRESDQKLINLWTASNKDNVSDAGITIPSDLFFAQTIPLMDCKIEVDERGYMEGGREVTYRVVIFNDYAQRIADADAGDITTVGAVIYNPIPNTPASLVFPISVSHGVDTIVSIGVGYKNMPAHMREKISSAASMQYFGNIEVSLLSTWYGIQIALLHPVIKDVFRHSRTTVDADNKGQTKSKKRSSKVKYIKKHVVNSEDLDAVLYGGNRSFTRTALVWYVIGHWRHYGSGAKTFIKGYWKGALRALHNENPEREREIVVCEPLPV